MEAVLFIFVIVFLMIVIFRAATRDHNTLQQQTRPRPATKLDIPITVTVSSRPYSTAGNQDLSRPSVDPDTLWVPAGQAVTVKEIQILGGMIYVGKKLPAGSIYRNTDPALINPSLAVNATNPDHQGSSLTYWPSYADLSPRARGAYLEWLSKGRRVPDTNIGYVFLFFYGLERRLLIDTKISEKARKEIGLIIVEVEQLLQVYGSSGSFVGYATGFLEYVRAKFQPDSISRDPSKMSRTWAFPLSLKLALAHFAETAMPLVPELALAWVKCDPQKWLRTPAQRCRGEFEALFSSRYHAKFGDGMILRPNDTKIKLEYRPASGGLSGLQFTEELQMPDITALSSPLKALQDIADSCIDDLQAYSRLIGRRPEDAFSLSAAALLPNEILASSSSDKIAGLRSILEQRSKATNPCIFKVHELLPLFEIEGKEKLTKSEAVSIAQLLGRLGYAVIPDIRFDEGRIDPESFVLVYRCGSIVQSAAGKAYDVSLMLLKIAFAVSAADNQIATQEEELLASQIEKMLDLSDFERERLRKYLLWLHLSPPELSGIKRKLGELSKTQKVEIADFALRIANADGVIDPQEVNILKRIYVLLGLKSQEVFSDIHRIQTSTGDEPATVLTESKASGYPIPRRKKTKEEDRSVTLDERLIQRTLRDTAAVQSILADVFEDSDSTQPVICTEHQGVIGLDYSHSTLLLELLAKSGWNVADFESVCSRYGILPAGAIETINSKTYEKFNEPLIEEGETIEINPAIAKEIKP